MAIPTSQTQDDVSAVNDSAQALEISSLIGFSKDTDWTFAESTMEIYEEALGEFSDSWGYTSYPS